LLAGPIFSREVLTAPRQLRHFLIRSGYVAALFVLMYTAGQAVFSMQQVRNVGDIARFGSLVFQLLSLVQLSLVLFFSLLFSAGSVAQEKDRRTLLLLLMTDLRDRELVLGKLCSSLLLVVVLLATSIPVFFLVHLLGGVSWQQIAWSLALMAAVGLAAGSWGTLVAFWRQQTFQTLAISVLGLVAFLGLVEGAVLLSGGASAIGGWVAAFDPYRAMLVILDPLGVSTGTGNRVALQSVAAMVGLAVVLNGVTVARLRIWNPSRVMHVHPDQVADTESGEAGAVRVRHRRIWTYPVIWREMRTRAYGRRMLVLKAAYITLAALAIWYLFAPGGPTTTGELVMGLVSPAAFTFVCLSLLSLLLINAQAVTSLTSERDGQTLELLLVTDVTAAEFIYGKLGGVVYNTRELILVPLVLVGIQLWQGGVGWEQFAYLLVGFAVLIVFAAMLGLHSGLSYESSRGAIANSLGTMFFLFIGIFVFLLLLVETRDTFGVQLVSFFVFIGLGGIGLWASLTHKNPSMALTIASGVLPFLTFWCITEFLRGGTLGVCLVMAGTYGFTVLAMLIPAVSAFDVALGRTTADEG